MNKYDEIMTENLAKAGVASTGKATLEFALNLGYN